MAETRGSEVPVFRCAGCGAFNRVPADRPGEAHCGRCHALLARDGAPQPVTAEGLERAVAGSPVPVLVDFWAPWCGPCRAVAPAVDRVARSRAGSAVVLKVDTEQHPGAGTRYRVSGIPTFVVFAGGTEAKRQVGAVPEPVLAALLDSPTAAPR